MRRIKLVQVVTLVLVLWFEASSALATTPEYVARMPSVETVKREISGFGPLHTAARQAAAFSQLKGIIREFSAGGEFELNMTADEDRLNSAYHRAWREIYAAGEERLVQQGGPAKGPKSPHGRWSVAFMHYDNDAFRAEVAETLLPEDLATRYARLHSSGTSGAPIAVILFVSIGALYLYLYRKMFPKRKDDDDIVGQSGVAFVSHGLVSVHTRGVKRREPKIFGQVLLWLLVVIPTTFVFCAVLVKFFPYFGATDGLFRFAGRSVLSLADLAYSFTL